MTKTPLARILLLVVACLCAFVACSEDNMLLSYQHSVQVGLNSVHTKLDTTLTDIKLYGLGRTDSLVHDARASELFMSLDLNHDTTQFRLVVHKYLEEEITFCYHKRFEPVASGNGMAAHITIDTVITTSYLIDSVAIVNREIKYNENLTNVRFYIY